MKNKIFFFGMTILILSLGLVFVSCGGDDDGGNGNGNYVEVTGVTLAPKTLSLTAVGATGTLTATVAPSNATDNTVTWSSSNESVATVANGVVTAVASGTTTITAYARSLLDTCAVTVTIPLPPEASSAPSLVINKFTELNGFVNAGDVKWVKFTAQAATTYLWNGLGSSSEYVDYQLYDASGATVGSGGTFRGNSASYVRQTLSSLTVNTTYYIKLTARTSLSDASIGFTNNTTEPTWE